MGMYEIHMAAMLKAIEAWDSQTTHEFSSDGLEAACLAFHEHMLEGSNLKQIIRTAMEQLEGRNDHGAFMTLKDGMQ